MPFFLSPTTGKRYYHRVTYSRYQEGQVIHLDEQRQQLICPDSQQPLLLDESKVRAMLEERAAPGYNEFAGMSPDRKKEMLQARSTENFKRDIAPRKEQLLKDAFNGKF